LHMLCLNRVRIRPDEDRVGRTRQSVVRGVVEAPYERVGGREGNERAENEDRLVHHSRMVRLSESLGERVEESCWT
jgi:hypothetical protein